MHTPEQIEKWAREADMECGADSLYIGTTADLTRFAALVAQHERERMAKVCDDLIQEHCAETQRAQDPEDQCHPDDWGCDFVSAWARAAAAIRNSDGG